MPDTLKFFNILFFAIFLICKTAIPSAAQEFSLLTVEDGNMVSDAYGHSALRVNDSTRNSDLIYHYGLYDFNTPNFVLKFMRGKLPYLMGAQRYSDFLYQYNSNKRTVYEQKLNLNQVQKDNLLRALRVNMQKENREYMYDFFFDNCATRLADLFKDNVSSLKLHDLGYDITFREMLKEHQKGHPWYDLGVDIVIGAVADRKASNYQQMFLPSYMKEILSEATTNNDRFLSESKKILIFDEEDKLRQESPWLTPKLLFIILAILFFIIRLPYRNTSSPLWLTVLDKSILALFGVIGILITFMWWGTDHVATKSNWNLLWANPLLLLIIWKSSKPTIKYIVYFIVGLCFISLFNVWFQLLPQYFPIAVGWLIMIEIMILIWILRTHASSIDHKSV